MNDNEDPDFGVLTSSEKEKNIMDVVKKVDALISVLGKQVVSGNFWVKNVCEALYQMLQFRTIDLHNENDFSAELSLLLSTCKFLISNITSHNFEHSSGQVNNVVVLNVLELCFESLIIVGEDDTCYDYVQSFFQTSRTEYCCVKLFSNQNDLSVFECFLNAIISVNVRQTINLPRTLDLLMNEQFLTAIKHVVIDVTNHNLSSFVLYAIVPKLVQITNCYLVVNMLSTSIKTTSESQHVSFPIKLFVLCGLADYLVGKTEDLSIIESHEFWNLLQKGLISADILLRKQALYLLKRTIDYLLALNISLDVQIFSWNSLKSSELQLIWEKVFILFEVLEEKQAHLVVPVIQSFLKSTDVGNSVHPCWVKAGYVRMLSHDSLQVVKLGITHFLGMSIDFFLNADGMSNRCIIEVLFQKLNNMLLYHSQGNVVDWSAIDISLRKWFTNITSHPKLKEDLFPVVVNAMTHVQWCTIPLFHVLYNLSLVPAVDIFDNTNLIVLTDFLHEAIKTQNVFIRGAVQCVILNVVSKGTKKSANIKQIISTLSVFRQNECLKRGLSSWEVTKEWISSLELKEGEIIEVLFLEENRVSIEAKARSLVLFVDSRSIDPNTNKFQEVLEEYFCVLKDTYKRPYASPEKSDNCLKWIIHILEELKSDNPESFPHSDSLIESISPYMNEAVFYIRKRLFEVDQLESFEMIELYACVLQSISDMGFIQIEEAISLYKVSQSLYFSPECHPVQRLLTLKIMVWFIRFGAAQKERMCAFEQVKEDCLLILKNDHLQLNLYKSGGDASLSRNYQVHWGALLSGCTCGLWSVLQECLDENIVAKEEILGLVSAEGIIQQAINSIESGGRDSLVPVLKVVRHVFPQALALACYPLCNQFLQFSWKSCFELRKISLFWPSIKAWIGLTFDKKVISTVEMKSAIIYFSEEILSEGEYVNGLSNVLLSHLRRELDDVETAKPLLQLLTKSLVFGIVPRKDQRIECDTYTLIGNLGAELAVNDLIPHPGYGNSQEVRLSALSVLLGVARQDGGTELVVSAVKQLIETDNQLTAKRQRYHGDSLHHRIKHRILQALLVLHQVLADSPAPVAKSCLVDLVKWASVGLRSESQQPSVRYQLEWLLVRALLSSPQMLVNFWTMFSESSEERTGSVCSFISVAYHLAAALLKTEFTDRCVSEILPWCMAQQFNIRLYAQVVLDKLWPLDSEVASKYEVLRRSLSKSLKHGNTLRNVEKLKNDFYFTVFHPLRHFSLETLFFELPRLSNLARDEWIPLSSIKDSLSNYDVFVPLINPDDSLKTFVPSSWVVKATADTEVEVEALAMQKKFVPWKSMFSESESPPSRTGLIVVASLIDKLPNLGGLTRTCEIFAAESLVVPSLEFTKDKMFSTLSMTAEKHIKIVEVKPHDLPKYLREKKKSGYTLVGAEQTASSVSLETYKFPKKCLLLLGNEKEGMPVNLLPLLDICVEVPQLGVIRSLNVHVTGALFVWEYTKQHLSPSSTRGGSSS